MIYRIGLLSGEEFCLKLCEDFKHIMLDDDSNCYEFYDSQNYMIACFPVHNIAYIIIGKGEE